MKLLKRSWSILFLCVVGTQLPCPAQDRNTVKSAANVQNILPPAADCTGFYPDGWVSREFSALLRSGNTAGVYVLHGQLPSLPQFVEKGTELQLSVDGSATRTVVVDVGDFSIATPVVTTPGPHLLQVASAKTDRLTLPDNRVISFHLTGVEYLTLDGELPVEKQGKVLQLFAGRGVMPDGWISTDASLDVAVTSACRVVIGVEFPEWAGLSETTVTVDTPGRNQPLAVKQLAPGFHEIECAMGAGEKSLHITTTKSFSIPQPDARTVALRIVSIRVQR